MAANDNAKFAGIAHLLNTLDMYEGDWDYDFQRFLGTAVPKPVPYEQQYSGGKQSDPGNYNYTPSKVDGAKTTFGNMSGPSPGGVYGNTWGIEVNPNEINKGHNFTNTTLLNDLKDACIALGLKVYLSDVFRTDAENVRGSAKHSLHKVGKALDVASVQGRSATVDNGYATALANWLMQNRGFTTTGNKRIIFGPKGGQYNPYNVGGHLTHIHLDVR